MKIALYMAYGDETVYEATNWRDDNNPSYVRLTEIVDVEFQRLPPSVVVPAQIAQLDAAEAELRNKFNEKLSELLDKRRELLALTHTSTTPGDDSGN
jgi:hypothetical protein